MATMNIYLSDKDEIKIKKQALAEGKSVSQFCRDKITQDSQEPELSRVTIEYQIEKLEKRIDDMSKIIADFAKINFKETHMSSNLVVGFFNAVIDDAEYKKQIYELAEKETEEYMVEVFGEEVKMEAEEKKLEAYSRLLDSIAWYNKGDIVKLAKMAKELGRNYTEDLTERKKLMLDSMDRRK